MLIRINSDDLGDFGRFQVTKRVIRYDVNVPEDETVKEGGGSYGHNGMTLYEITFFS